MKRIALVCGGRTYGDADALDAALGRLHPSVVVTGGAPGADALAEAWARRTGTFVVVVPALWDAQGRAAGPRRNGFMLMVAMSLRTLYPEGECSVGVVAFPGGSGTANMTGRADLAGVPVWRP